MKIAHLLAGVAALTLTAGAASAQAPLVPSTITSTSTSSASEGTASGSSVSIFNLRANVAQDCSFFTGGGAYDVNFGTLGIYNTSTQGLARAFTMTGPASVTVTTDVAGCNTASTVKIDKAGDAAGMRGDNAGGFDAVQFQNNLPYSVVARYSAGAGGATGTKSAQDQELEVAANEGEKTSARHGAWKSAMELTFTVPEAEKALVAGDYTDSVTVTLAATL